MNWTLRLLTAATLVAIAIGVVFGAHDEASGDDHEDHLDVAVSLAVTRTGAPDLANSQTWLNVSPDDNLQALVDSSPAGQAYRLAPGLYRLAQLTPRDGDVFYGEPGAVLNGSRLLTEFSHEGSVWIGPLCM